MQHRHREKGLSAIRIYKPHTQPFCANFHHHTNSTPILTFIAKLLLRDVTVSPSKNKRNKERKKKEMWPAEALIDSDMQPRPRG